MRLIHLLIIAVVLFICASGELWAAKAPRAPRTPAPAEPVAPTAPVAPVALADDPKRKRGETFELPEGDVIKTDPVFEDLDKFNEQRPAVFARLTNMARTCHEANRAYCQAMGDNSQLPWDEAPEWQRQSALNGVAFHLSNPQAGPDASHNAWMADKVAAGWVYGPVKDAEKRQHPCIVAYGQLPKEQQAKDYIFRAIVHGMNTDPKGSLIPREAAIESEIKRLDQLQSTPARCEEIHAALNHLRQALGWLGERAKREIAEAKAAEAPAA